jgi:hypothetical protein
MKLIFDRIKEPSTWAGLGMFAAMFGVPQTTFGMIQQVVMGIAGLVAVALPENKA